MELLKTLNSLNSTEDFIKFIEHNCEEFIDYFSITNYLELTNSKVEFHRLALKANLLSNYNNQSDKITAFIFLVLKTSIRLGDRLVFQRFYDLLENNKIEKSLLIESSSLFMLNVRNFIDFKNRFEEILIGLEEVYHLESDSKKDSISAIVNYYSIVVGSFLEFAPDAVKEINELISEQYYIKKFTFLDDPIIKEICNVDLVNIISPIELIQSLLDNFLVRIVSTSYNSSIYLLEEGTEYSINFSERKNLSEIISLNKTLYEPIKSNSVYYSLERGVKILEQELQLLAYVYSFGNMHKAKLMTLINATPVFESSHTVIDWGCGQGLGTLMYLENKDNCENCILIEPSELALQRASLHIQSWNPNIITINKGFDDLVSDDFSSIKKSARYVHLMSNILDMDVFSLKKLIENIELHFTGENYFLIASPYIDISRTERIDAFVSHFESSPSFKILEKVTEKKGEWRGTNWSRVIRVFKVDLV